MYHFKEMDFGLEKNKINLFFGERVGGGGVPNLLFGRASFSVCCAWF